MILPMINNKGAVAKIPYPPKVLLTNQGKNGIAEKNIKGMQYTSAYKHSLVIFNVIALHFMSPLVKVIIFTADFKPTV